MRRLVGINSRQRTASAIAIFLFTLYLWAYRGLSHSTDEWFFIDEMTEVLRTGFRAIHVQYAGYYFLGIPLLLLSRLVETFGTFQILNLLNSATTAITGGLIVLLLGELGHGLTESAVTALVYGAATLALPYSGYLLREPTAAMWLLMAALFLLRYRFRGGWTHIMATSLALIGAAFTKLSTSSLTVLYLSYFVYSLYARREPAFFWRSWSKMSVKYKLVLSLALLLGAGFTLWFTTKPYIPFPRNVNEALPDFVNLAGLLFGPGWGLFLFSPVLLLVIPGIKGFLQKHLIEACFLVGIPLIYILGCTRYPVWWGTWTWGPKQVNPALPLLILPMAETLRLYGSRAKFKLVLGVLLPLSAALAAMQTLVGFPFYEVAFLAGISEKEFIWNWSTSPPLNHWRFLNIAKAEVAWATPDGVRWAMLLSLSILVGLGAWLLVRTMRNRWAHWGLYAGGTVLLSLVLTAATLHFSYLDERYGAKLGFVEAARLIREESRPDDVLMIYMWGEPPLRTYLPRMAMLNYCKGLCPRSVPVIEQEFIEGQPDWEQHLFGLLGDANRVWVVMEGLPETSLDRPVEFALAKRLYFVQSVWTGPTVRVVEFERGLGEEKVSLVPSPRQSDAGLKSCRILSPSPPLRPGDSLYLSLEWYNLPSDTPLSVSIQLVDAGWNLRVQKDVPVSLLLAPGSLGPASLSFSIPSELEPGPYNLTLVVYDSQTLQRLSFPDGRDHLEMWRLSVQEE